MMKMHAILAAALAGVAILVGCGGSGGSGGSNPPAGNGTLSVQLADAPDPNITRLDITIDRVEANVNGEWRTVMDEPRTLNVLDFADAPTDLGSVNLPAGDYGQIRLITSAATVTDAEGVEHEVNIPSGEQTGIKLNVNYEITPNEVTTLLLDFNVHKSLNKLGNGSYQLKPVIPVVVKVLSGTITGRVTLNGANRGGAVVRAVYRGGDAYPVGTEVNTSVSQSDGTFRIWALMPGTYDLQAIWTDGGGGEHSAIREDVVVTANHDTDAGTLAIIDAD